MYSNIGVIGIRCEFLKHKKLDGSFLQQKFGFLTGNNYVTPLKDSNNRIQQI